jgi:hypothetical protein
VGSIRVTSPDPRVLDVGRRAALAALDLDVHLERLTGTRPLMAIFDPEVAAAARRGAVMGPRRSAAELIDDFAALASELGEAVGGEAAVLAEMLRAYRTQARVAAGDAVAWVEQVRDAIGVDVDRIAPPVLDHLAEQLAAALAAAGFPGDVAAALPRWSAERRVGVDAFRAAAAATLEEARARSAALLPLPAATDLRLEIVHGVFYGGYNEYLHDFRGECRLNGDVAWTTPQLRHTIAHEAFPGHHAISALREAQGRAGELAGGALLYIARTPLTPVIEGVCEVASRRLGWGWDADAEVYDHLNRYRKAVTTDVAVAVHRDGMQRAEAIDLLERRAFVARESAERSWTFITHPLWHVTYPHYWYGTEGVRAALAQLDAAGIGDAWTDLTHVNAHTLATLAAAAEAAVAQRAPAGGRP